MTQRVQSWAWTGVGAVIGLALVGIVPLATWVEVDAQRHLPGTPVLIPASASEVCLEADPTTCVPQTEVTAWLKDRQKGGTLIPVRSAPAPSDPRAPSPPASGRK